jgi:hypothetical protein
MAILSSNNGESNLEFVFHKFENQDDPDQWIIGDLLFNNSQFSAKINYDAQYLLKYIQNLIDDLKQLLESKTMQLNYDGIEPYLEMTINNIKYGKFIVNGIFRSAKFDGNELKFNFETDQTYIRQFYNQLINEIKLINY